MTEYHLYHPVTDALIVVDRMTAREARKRNEALEAMRFPYRWEDARATLPMPSRSVEPMRRLAA